MSPFRKPLGKLCRLLGSDSRRQRTVAVGQQPAEHSLDRVDTFALAENNLGITAAAAAIEIELHIAQIGRLRPGQLLQKVIDRNLSARQLLGESRDGVGVHGFIVVDRVPQ